MEERDIDIITRAVIERIEAQYFLTKKDDYHTKQKEIDNYFLDVLLRFMCKRYHTSPEIICGASRLNENVQVRAIFMYVARKFSNKAVTITDVSEKIGRSHCLVTHHVTRIEQVMKEPKLDPEIYSEVVACEVSFRSFMQKKHSKINYK